jgi:hypothetical protein
MAPGETNVATGAGAAAQRRAFNPFFFTRPLGVR